MKTALATAGFLAAAFFWIVVDSLRDLHRETDAIKSEIAAIKARIESEARWIDYLKTRAVENKESAPIVP